MLYKVSKDDTKPKIICGNCYISILNLIAMKKKCSESQIVFNKLEKKMVSILLLLSL